MEDMPLNYLLGMAPHMQIAGHEQAYHEENRYVFTDQVIRHGGKPSA